MAVALSRPVPTSFWLSVDENYTLDDKLLYLYLITNEHFLQHAVYKLPKRIMMTELGMETEKFSQAFSNLENKHKVIKYSEETKEVAILDYYSFGILKGGKPLNDCFNHLGKKVEDFSLLKAVYERSLSLVDDRDAFKTVMSKVSAFLVSVGLLEENIEEETVLADDDIFEFGEEEPHREMDKAGKVYPYGYFDDGGVYHPNP